MKLVAIPESGDLPSDVGSYDMLDAILSMTRSQYESAGFAPPWCGYIAVREAQPVGTCGFKSQPTGGKVEIAYFTFPEYEGRGAATWMAQKLVQIARTCDPGVQVIAQTLPEEGASTAILRKLKFELAGSVEHPEDGTVWEWLLDAPE